MKVERKDSITFGRKVGIFEVKVDSITVGRHDGLIIGR